MSAPLTSAPSALAVADPVQRLSIHDVASVERYFRQQRWDPYPLKRLRYLMYAESRNPRQLVESLPPSCREEVAATFSFHASDIVERVDSEQDGATKLLFQTSDQRLFEAVVMCNAAGRISLCVSSQVGCAAGCRFCATGQMGLTRNLREAEILDQVYQANQLLRASGQRVRNVVFMGMGEPFHNESALSAAIEKLQDPAWFGLSPRRILVSTVGIPEAMIRFAQKFPITGLALSLHSCRQSLRERLIPVARRYPLDQLRETLFEVQRFQRSPLMIEYLMLDGINDSATDAQLLADYVQGLHVHINLIPYNAISGSATAPDSTSPDGIPADGSRIAEHRNSADMPAAPQLPGSKISQEDHGDILSPESLRTTPRPRRDAFANQLRQRGLLATIRYSRGSDIAAACGQLVRNARPIRLRESQTPFEKA
jgi:23S rRNA (adenine2503-C2)-methyltransferase